MSGNGQEDSSGRNQNSFARLPSREEVLTVKETSGLVSKDVQTYSHSFQGEKYLFTDPIPEELVCSVCYEILFKPHQTMCGHLFCKGCLTKVTGKPHIKVNERVRCPFCRSEGQRVFKDRHIDRKVKNLTIECPNTPCSWKGSLCHLEQHRKDAKGCWYENIACPRGCNIKIARKTLEKHQKEECPKRRETCKHCGWAGTHESMPDHHKECLRFPITCPNNCPQSAIPRGKMSEHLQICPKERVVCSRGCSMKVAREDLLTHETNNCPKRLVKCEHCTSALFYENMKSHNKICAKYPIPCLNNCMIGTVPRDGLERHLQTCPKQKIKCLYHKIGCSEAIERGEVEEHEDKAREHHLQLCMEMITRLNDTVSALSTIVMDNRSQPTPDSAPVDMNQLQTGQPSNVSHTHIPPKITKPKLPLITRNRPWLENCGLIPIMPWVVKVNNFDERKRKNEMWKSEPIFTENNGYQLGLRVYPNASSQQHVSVYCQLRSGPNDDLLLWPFRGTIKYSLLNQEENTNHKSYIVEFGYGICSERVTDGSGPGKGASQFIAHENLNGRGITYLDNDCLYFCVELIRQVP